MTTPVTTIDVVDGDEVRRLAPELAEVLIDCVHGGASVGFLAPLTEDRALAFWEGVAAKADAGSWLVLVARDAEGVHGTVQVRLAEAENQPHRVDVAKLLVHRRARRRGLATRLMAAADDAARRAGRRVAVLDTVPGTDAERLYQRLGWTAAGVIPDYAQTPDGSLCPTTVFWKRL